MQAILLTAGLSSRFVPFRDLPHKSAFKIMGKMLIEYTIESIRKSEINDIIVVVSHDSNIPNLLGNGDKYGVSIQYAYQKDSTGMGGAILSARELITAPRFFVLHPYHIDFYEYKAELEQHDGVVLLSKPQSDISEYGNLVMDGDRVTDVIEKSQDSTNGDKNRIIGIYLLNQEFIKTLENTSLEHYQFENALAIFVKSNITHAVKIQENNISVLVPLG